MKIVISQEKIKQGMSIIERISSKSITLPILNNVLLSAEKNFLSLSATDLELGINWWVLSKVEKEGKITVPSKILSNFVDLLPNDKIEIESKKDNLLISSKNYNTQILGTSPEEFPIIPKISEGEYISISPQSFCTGLSYVSDIAGQSTARPEISGIFISFKEKEIVMVATDSFRLAEKVLKVKKNNLKKEYSLIIPQKTAKEIINIFSSFEKDLKIYFSSNQIMVEGEMTETKHPQAQLISRLIDGEYPNYKEIIPQKSSTTVVLSRLDILNHIKSAGIFSEKTGEVKIRIDKKKEVEILSESIELGEHKSRIEGEVKGENLEISFNYRFLINGLSLLKSSEVIFEFNGDSSPGIIRAVGDDSFTYVVMPIKI